MRVTHETNYWRWMGKWMLWSLFILVVETFGHAIGAAIGFSTPAAPGHTISAVSLLLALHRFED